MISPTSPRIADRFAPGPHRAGRRRGKGFRLFCLLTAAPAAASLGGLTGCAVSQMRDGVSEGLTRVKAEIAAEKAYLHRGDIFHECCSSPLDFKNGFKNGYVQVAMNGDDQCAPPTPPKCYWGCTGGDPCERVELMNCYYDGWAHGAIAAGQDGVVGLNTVPIRNLCGPGAGGGYPPGPSGYGPGEYRPDGPGVDPGDVPPAPVPGLYADPADVLDAFDAGVAPAPPPLPVGPPDGAAAEESVGGNAGGPLDDAPALLDRLLDADRLPAPPPVPAVPTAPVPDGAPADPAAGGAGTDPFGPDARRAAPRPSAGPKVTVLWDASAG